MFEKLKQMIHEYTNWGRTRYLNYLYKYDMKKYLEYSCMNENNCETLATKMRILSHTIEKGLSLPECRPGFGVKKVQELVELYNEYSKYQERKDTQVLDLVRTTISAYINFQESNNCDVSFIPNEFWETKNEIIQSGVIYIQGKKTTGFSKIAHGRHSVRYYSDEKVENCDIIEAVSLAQTAPSACNRQATHVFACMDDKKKEKIIQMHGGVRGFGKPAVIFAITGDLNLYMGEYERNTVFVDGGIFLMNLLYSLEACGIAACPIIWGAVPSDDEKLSEILSIPNSHKIIALVMAGYFPNGEIKVAASPKRETQSILHFIDDN